jgi:hypothetical protein
VFNTYSILPIILAGKNITLNNKIGKIQIAKENAEKRRKILESRK